VHKVYFPNGGPVGYNVRVIAPEGDGFVTVEFEIDGIRESVPEADVFDCDDVTCDHNATVEELRSR
jgi:hypothetical protein